MADIPLICENISVKNNTLYFAGQNTELLAKRYGTPVYLMDENRIRERCRTYLGALNEAFGGNAKALYASKACSFKRIYEIMKEEGMGVDVVSSGEIKVRKERKGRNPNKPQDVVRIPERAVVKFRAGKELKEAVEKLNPAKIK